VSDPSFAQLWDDVFLNTIKPVEPPKSAASLMTEKKYFKFVNQHKIINIDT